MGDPRMVQELHKRTARAPTKEFKTSNFIPKLARDRQASATKMLMEYKKVNEDFRFIIRNDVNDIRVLIKRYSEGSRLPYRPMSLKILGAISPIKPRTKETSEETTVSGDKEDDGNKFVSPHRKGARENYIPKETIFKNITATQPNSTQPIPIQPNP